MKRILFAHIIFVVAMPGLALAHAATGSKESCPEIKSVRHIPFHPEDKVDAAFCDDQKVLS